MAKYVYPAIFTPDGGKFSIDFPDIAGCYTCGDDLWDGLAMAADALALMLTYLEDEGREIPEATDITSLQLPDGAFSSYVACDTADYRKNLSGRARTVEMAARAGNIAD